jgi:hypothetical protein
MDLSEKRLALIALLIFLTVMGLVGRADYEDELAEESFYEQMVCDGHWPDYKNVGVSCEKTSP